MTFINNDLDINWDTLRNSKAPIIPEKKSETDTDNFARMEERINASEREHPFLTTADDKDDSSKKVTCRLENYRLIV